MKQLFVIFTLFLSQYQTFPIPSGQIIKYRVSSKYFNRQNITSTSSDNSLYQLLSQIHYGPSTSEVPATIVSEQVTTTANELYPEDSSNDNKNNDADVTTVINSITNEYPETVTNEFEDDVPATKQPISMDIVEVNSDINDVQTDLIEKVGEEKLATEAELITTTEASSLDDANNNNNSDENIMKHEDDEESSSISSIEMTTISDAVDLDSETETNKIETNSNDKVYVEDKNESKVPESLLSAVSDLLSSVLGINIGKFDSISQEIVADVSDSQPITTTTESSEHQEASEQSIALESTVSNADEKLLPASVDHNPTSELVAPVVNEVDLKIENLANIETSFVTENTPEVYAEQSDDDTVKEQSDVKDENDDDKIVLETLSELSTINDAGDEEPVSAFEDSVNQVMNLVRGTEGKLAIEVAQNVVDSILIDKHMEDSVGDLDQIVYGTLKEIETNLGLNDEEEKKLPVDSFDPIDHEREEMIKNFETDINESLRLVNPDELDYESLEIEPNAAKAAVYYKFQYGDDF